MTPTKKISIRQTAMSMMAEEVRRFPVAKHKSIRSMLYDLQRMGLGYQFTTETTPVHLIVTCVSRPE